MVTLNNKKNKHRQLKKPKINFITLSAASSPPRNMKTINVIAVKHNKRRNGEKCKTYWSISEEITADPNNLRIERVNTIWWHTDLPKKIKNVLEMSPDDHKRYGLKRGEFVLTLTQVEKFGHVPFENLINIEPTK